MRLQIADCKLQIGVALIGCLLSAAPCRAEIMDRVLAVVAGELILLSDVRAAREFGFVATERSGDQDAQALARLIDRALILAEVDRFAPPEPDSSAVDKGVAALRQRFSTAESFAAALARLGIEERHLREYVRQDLRMAAYLEQRFTTIPPLEDEIGRYYREHPDRFTRDGVLMPLDDARPAIVQALSAQGREALVGDWLAGLRRRADIRMGNR